MATRGWMLRDFQDGDQPAVDALLDDEPDPLFAAQGHPLHGPPREGDRWRRTVLAECDQQVVAAASVARNKWHPTRFTVVVEVAASCRRRGLGRAMVDAVRARQPGARFYGKVKASNAAAAGLTRAIGARVLVTSPSPRADAETEDLIAWRDGQVPPADVILAPLIELGQADWAGL